MCRPWKLYLKFLLNFEIFNNDSGLDVGALLQSLTAQNSKLKDFSFQDFLSTNGLDENSFSQLENRKGLITDLLKQAGFTDKEAKNLIQKFKSKVYLVNTEQKMYVTVLRVRYYFRC